MAFSQSSFTSQKNKAIEEVDLRNIVTNEFPQDPFELLGEKYFNKSHELPKTEAGTQVQEFYRDSSVFVTGATGFIGLTLVEKLLRSCPHIKRVFILLRGKNGKTALQRFEKILQNRIFTRLKHEVPGFKDKLSVIDGDMDRTDLGITPEAMQQITNEVDIIFNVGASVRFNDTLKHSLETNTKSMREILKIARKIKYLKALIHVSTIYTFFNCEVIEEKVFSMPIDYEHLLKLVDSELEATETELLKKWSDTYQITKTLTECLLQREARGLPVVICRPSLVTHSYREPVKGWMGNRYGHIGRDIAVNSGLIRVIRGNQNDEVNDFIPVDYFVNFLICAAFKTFSKRKNSATNDSSVQVYNFVNARRVTITWKELYRSTYDDVHRKWPLSKIYWYPLIIFIENEKLYKLAAFFLQTIPGTVFDAIAKICGKTPIMLKTSETIEKVEKYFRFYRQNKWIFIHENMDNLWNSLSPEDKNLFLFNFDDLDMEEYVSTFTLGTRVHLLNDDINTLPEARRRIKRLYYIHLGMKFIFFGLGLFILYEVIGVRKI